jgi:methyltransferase family protein
VVEKPASIGLSGHGRSRKNLQQRFRLSARRLNDERMALLKIYRYGRQHGLASLLNKVRERAPGYIKKFYLWRVRRCLCCDRITVFLSITTAGETRTCLFCSANERYELLAMEIKSRFGEKLSEKDVLELDPHSPLRKLLSRSHSHVRTFFSAGVEGGTIRADGAVCEDITSLTVADESFDLIISSDVLEHVPRLNMAFSETARVLRPGGAHLFTVPPRAGTKKRAEIIGGKVNHIETPEYHLDPLSPQGILTFWEVGPDLPEIFPTAGLDIRIARGPVGDEGRVVWIAERKP